MWKEFCSSLGAQVSLSSGFHLQTNEHTERMNQPSVQYHPTNPPGAVNWHGLTTLTIHPLHLQLVSHLLNHLWGISPLCSYMLKVSAQFVLCKLCKEEFACHQSTSTLRYHLNAATCCSEHGTCGSC